MRQKTDRELKALAVRFCKNEIFTSLQIRKDDMHLLLNIFLPLVLMDTSQLPSDIGMFYAEYGSSCSMAVNGYPVFGSCFYLNNDDTKFFAEQAENIKQTLQEFTREEIPEIL